VLAAALHECGHLLAARRLHIPLRLLELDLMGARLYPARSIPSYRAEALLAAAGPLCSILLAVPLLTTRIPFFVALRTAPLSFALFNLLPIEGFDGGRVLFSLFACRLGENAARRVLLASSYLSLLFLFSLASCLLLRYGEDATLAVLSASLFARLFLSLDPFARGIKRGGKKK
jgi:stage IV sporulation protein FB